MNEKEICESCGKPINTDECLEVEPNEDTVNINDITNKIEKIPSLEKKFGVEINRLFGQIERSRFGDEYIINIFGEIKPSNGVVKSDMLEIIADVIDKDDRIIGRDSTFGFDNIKDFESFNLSIYLSEIPDRIRLYLSAF